MDDDRGITQSARLEKMCSAEDDEPENLLLEYLNHRSASAKQQSQKMTPNDGFQSYRSPREEAKAECRCSGVGQVEVNNEDRAGMQSARLEKMCSATDEDEPEAVILELLHAHTSSFKMQQNSAKSQDHTAHGHIELDPVHYVSVAEDWDDDVSVARHRSCKTMKIDLSDSHSGFLYGSPGISKSMQAMKPKLDDNTSDRSMMKTSSLYNIQTTPARLPRKGMAADEPCSPGLLPSSEKRNYDEKEEGKERSSDEEDVQPDIRELPYAENLFSKIRHNRIGYVTSELEKGCDVSIQDINGNTMLHICAQNNLKKMAKVCLQYNCNINATNSDGRTPLDICDKLQFKPMGDWLIFMGAENGLS